MRTNAMVVDISRSSLLFSSASNADSSGTSSGSALRRRCGSEPPSALTRSRRYCISGLSSAGL